MPKWVYPLAFVFLLFVIYNDPTGAGSMAHAFADFVGRLISALGQFFSGLFGGGEPSSFTDTGAGAGSPALNIQPRVTVPGYTATTDVFVHGHSHGYTGG